MSFLRFDGQGAGLGTRAGGDANSPFDYTLFCACKKELGPLGKFSENPESGRRTALCPNCLHVTIVKGATIEKVVKASKEVVDRLLLSMGVRA